MIRSTKPRVRGFTLLEALLSSTILAGALVTALAVSHAATRASNRAVVTATQEAAATRRLEQLRRVLGRAAASTLVAVPTSQSDPDGNTSVLLPEPMQDGTTYDNLAYREPVGFADGEVLYDPPTGVDPRRIALELDESRGVGALVLQTTDRDFVLAEDVASVAFIRTGDEVVIELTTQPSPHDEPAMHRIAIALHAR
jgi:type II secretory pathway pseudopilin PulG